MAKCEIVRGLIVADRRERVRHTTLPRLGGIVARDDRTHVFLHRTVTPDSDDTPDEWENEAEVCRRMRRPRTIRPDLGRDVPDDGVAFLMGGDEPLIGEGRGEDRCAPDTRGHHTRAIAGAFARDDGR